MLLKPHACCRSALWLAIGPMAIGGWLPWYRLLDLQLLWVAKHAPYFLPPLEYCQGYDDDDPVWHRREEGREKERSDEYNRE